MADGKEQPKISEAEVKPEFSQLQRDYMRLMELQNQARVKQLLEIRRRSNLTALGLGVFVVGLYCFSMVAIKQETFLDDFEEPKLVEKKVEK